MGCRKVIPEFIELDCEFEAGRVNSLAFVTEELAAQADADPTLWSNPTFWSTETYTGDILIHKDVSGSYTGADTTVAGKGTQQERNSGTTHTLTCRVESVKGNTKYWSDLKVSTNYRVVFLGDLKNTMFVSTTNCRISANVILEDDINSINEVEVVCVWADIRLPETYDPPQGVFD